MERLVGEVGGHESPQSLNHSESCVAVQVQREPVVTIRCSYREAGTIFKQVFSVRAANQSKGAYKYKSSLLNESQSYSYSAKMNGADHFS